MAGSSLAQEALDAWHGTLRLMGGKPEAPGYFDMSRRGLYGSFIALILSGAAMGALLAYGEGQAEAPPGDSLFSLFVDVAAYGAQVLVAWIAFGVFGRRERFEPFLVVDNWVSAISVVALIAVTVGGALGALTLVGPTGGEAAANAVLIGWLVVVLARLALLANTLRLVVGLSGGRIAITIAGQLLAILMIMGLITGAVQAG